MIVCLCVEGGIYGKGGLFGLVCCKLQALHGSLRIRAPANIFRIHPVQVSHLIHTCLSKLYNHGDIISIYSLVADLQKALNPKDPASKHVAEVWGSVG